METTKNICCAKGEGAANHRTVTRWLKKFCLGYKNLDNQAKLGRSKIVDSKAKLQATEANSVSSTWRVSGELDLLQSSVVHHLHDLNKNI